MARYNLRTTGVSGAVGGAAWAFLSCPDVNAYPVGVLDFAANIFHRSEDFRAGITRQDATIHVKDVGAGDSVDIGYVGLFLVGEKVEIGGSNSSSRSGKSKCSLSRPRTRAEAATRELTPWPGVEPWHCLPRTVNFSQSTLFSATSMRLPSELPKSGTRMRSSALKSSGSFLRM